MSTIPESEPSYGFNSHAFTTFSGTVGEFYKELEDDAMQLPTSLFQQGESSSQVISSLEMESMVGSSPSLRIKSKEEKSEIKLKETVIKCLKNVARVLVFLVGVGPFLGVAVIGLVLCLPLRALSYFESSCSAKNASGASSVLRGAILGLGSPVAVPAFLLSPLTAFVMGKPLTKEGLQSAAYFTMNFSSAPFESARTKYNIGSIMDTASDPCTTSKEIDLKLHQEFLRSGQIKAEVFTEALNNRILNLTLLDSQVESRKLLEAKNLFLKRFENDVDQSLIYGDL